MIIRLFRFLLLFLLLSCDSPSDKRVQFVINNLEVRDTIMISGKGFKNHDEYTSYHKNDVEKIKINESINVKAKKLNLITLNSKEKLKNTQFTVELVKFTDVFSSKYGQQIILIDYKDTATFNKQILFDNKLLFKRVWKNYWEFNPQK